MLPICSIKMLSFHTVIKNGSTPLMVAVAGGHAEINCLFLGEGDKWGVKSKEGWASLKVVFKLGKKKVVLQLMEAGANK